MSVKRLIIAAVATRSVFRRFAELSEDEKKEVVEKVKTKMKDKGSPDDKEAPDEAKPDAEESAPEEKPEGKPDAEAVPEEENPDTNNEEPADKEEGEDGDDDAGEENEDIFDDGEDAEDGEDDDDTEEVEEVGPDSEEAEPEAEPEGEEPIEEPVEVDEEPVEVDEEKKGEMDSIVNDLVEEVKTIKQDGQVAPKDVMGLIQNMMEMVNLLVQAKPPTARRRRRGATREFEIAMKVAGVDISVGDSVMYSRNFLRSIGEFGEMGHWKGSVKSVRPMGGMTLAEVQWDNGDAPMKVNVNNLILTSRRHLELASAKTAGHSFAIENFNVEVEGWQPVNVDVMREIQRDVWFDFRDDQGDLYEDGQFQIVNVKWLDKHLTWQEEQQMKKRKEAPVTQIFGRIPKGSASTALKALQQQLGRKFSLVVRELR